VTIQKPRVDQAADQASSQTQTRPAVSVIIPVRNRARLIRQALDSVYAQTFRDFEIIVVDDGSTDDTRTVVEAYGRPVQLISREPTGVSAARNVGIAQARGDYIALLDSDDWFEPTKLEKQVALFANHPRVGLVYTRYLVSDERTGKQWLYTGGLSSQGDAFRDLLMGFMETPLTTPTVMVRRRVFDTVAPFDTTMHMAEDIDLWCRIASQFEFGFIDEPLSVIRYHSGNTSGRTTALENLQIWSPIARRNLALRDPRLTFAFRRRVWAKIYWTVAEHRRASSGGSFNRHHVKSILMWPSPGAARLLQSLRKLASGR
jgi:glycosyltransferase involved in cell wall biosynthesis